MKSDDTTTVIPSPLTTGRQAACRETAVFLGGSNLCLITISEQVLAPEPRSCLRGFVCCLFDTTCWAMYLRQHLDFRLPFNVANERKNNLKPTFPILWYLTVKLYTTEGTRPDLKIFEVSRTIPTDFNVLWVKAIGGRKQMFSAPKKY